MKDLRIVVADDHAVICQCLKALLNAQPGMKIVGTALRGEDACRMAIELKPDIIVMDLVMPGLGGAATTKRLKELCQQIEIVVFSGHDDETYVRQVLDYGALGYVLKSSDVKELVQALRAVAEGQTYVSPPIAKKLATVNKASKESALSQREKDILRLAATGLSNKEIAAVVGYRTKTVETYKARIYKKMNFDSRVDLMRYALTHGLLTGEADIHPETVIHRNDSWGQPKQ